MSFIDNIFNLVWGICWYFYNAYVEVKDWVWPFSYLQYLFYYLHDAFYDLSYAILDFGDWVDDVWSKVQNILTSEGVLGLLKWWFPWLENVGLWFTDRWKWFTTSVGNWWETIKPTVLGWIELAKQLAKDLVANVQKELSQVHTSWDNFWTLTWPQWMYQFNGLAIAWDNFWTITFPTLISSKDANDLMDTKIKEAEPGWLGWTDFKDKVVLFFTDPLSWLVDRLEDWFWGIQE